MTEVSLKDIFKIIKEFKDVPYEGYASKRYKHIPTESYLYLARQLENYTMSNFHGLVRTYKKSTQKIPNLHVCSTDESKSKRINADEIESKSVHVNVYFRTRANQQFFTKWI